MNLPHVIPWTITEDARRYRGPFPVVAHPPCGLWGALAAVNYARWGGEHNKPGNDGGCFEAALASVCRYGGVLEHPAKTKAWPAYGLTRPRFGQWTQGSGGWVTEVWQSAYGHRADKITWLYYCGPTPPDLRWVRVRGTHRIGGHGLTPKDRSRKRLARRWSKETPIEFRDELIRLAQLNYYEKTEKTIWRRSRTAI